MWGGVGGRSSSSAPGGGGGRGGGSWVGGGGGVCRRCMWCVAGQMGRWGGVGGMGRFVILAARRLGVGRGGARSPPGKGRRGRGGRRGGGGVDEKTGWWFSCGGGWGRRRVLFLRFFTTRPVQAASAREVVSGGGGGGGWPARPARGGWPGEARGIFVFLWLRGGGGRGGGGGGVFFGGGGGGDLSGFILPQCRGGFPPPRNGALVQRAGLQSRLRIYQPGFRGRLASAARRQPGGDVRAHIAVAAGVAWTCSVGAGAWFLAASRFACEVCHTWRPIVRKTNMKGSF